MNARASSGRRSPPSAVTRSPVVSLLRSSAAADSRPASTMPVLKMLSQVGLILFMFLIGLELDPKLLKGRGHAVPVPASADFAAGE